MNECMEESCANEKLPHACPIHLTNFSISLFFEGEDGRAFERAERFEFLKYVRKLFISSQFKDLLG